MGWFARRRHAVVAVAVLSLSSGVMVGSAPMYWTSVLPYGGRV